MSELQTITRGDSIEINALIEEVLEDLEPLAREKKVVLIQRKSNELFMTGGDILIYRVVFNLVENSIKYNYDGGQVRVSVMEKDNNVVITVQDTGNGIPREYRE